MSIETTLAELVEAEPALRKISTQNSMSEKTKYHVAKLAKLVAAEVKQFHDQRAAMFEELGTERECRNEAERQLHGATVREIPADKVPEFRRRVLELGSLPVTVPWKPLRSVDLPSALASDLLDLGPLCELVDPDEPG